MDRCPFFVEALASLVGAGFCGRFDHFECASNVRVRSRTGVWRIQSRIGREPMRRLGSYFQDDVASAETRPYQADDRNI